MHEPVELLPGAEAHHAFDAGTVVPGAVEEDHFPCGRQMGDVALEEPLGGFAFTGLFQRHDAGPARVQVLGEPLDGSALAGGVSALEEHHESAPGGLDPDLQLEQLDLQQPLFQVVLCTVHARGIRVALPPGVHDFAGGGQQDRVVVIVVADGVAVGGQIKQLHGVTVSARHERKMNIGCPKGGL